MAKIPLDMAMQDESYFFQFLLNSPRHGVVLSIIGGALQKYHKVLHDAVKAHDIGLQQDIALITRFLKAEAADRVHIRSEYLLIHSLERLHGYDAVTTLLEKQKLVIAELQTEILGSHPSSLTLEQAFESAGVYRVPTWGVELGRANIGPRASLRVMRHEVFSLTREMHKAYYRGEKQESWRLKLRSEGAQRKLGRYSDIAFKSCALRMIKSLYGDDEVQRVLSYAKSNTRLSEYEGARNAIQACKFEGRIYSRPPSKKQVRTN